MVLNRRHWGQSQKGLEEGGQEQNGRGGRSEAESHWNGKGEWRYVEDLYQLEEEVM